MKKHGFVFLAVGLLLGGVVFGGPSERIAALEKALPSVRAKDPLMAKWLSYQPGILRRLQGHLAQDKAAGNTVRASAEEKDLEYLLSRVEQEVAWVQKAPVFSGKRLNVKDFGAIGDGVANDAPAIRKAIAAAAAGLVRTVFLPKGRYLLVPEMPAKVPANEATETWPLSHP